MIEKLYLRLLAAMIGKRVVLANVRFRGIIEIDRLAIVIGCVSS